jgi:hypothetical protein
MLSQHRLRIALLLSLFVIGLNVLIVVKGLV